MFEYRLSIVDDNRTKFIKKFFWQQKSYVCRLATDNTTNNQLISLVEP